ncbi:MAG TPA: thioredoxin family protein [Acetobacteraceae bacterium]|nr:thioredoxin family protein [Acetobacteraceae bacterium]
MPRIARRSLMAGLALSPLAARAAPVRTESGWTQDWYHEGFLNLREDLEEAQGAGLRFAVEFHQRGCPYCVEMHTDHFAQAEIEGFVRPRFRIVQLDLHGSRPVTDFDGEVLEERALARKWRVTFTPTFLFFPEWQGEGPPRRSGREIEVARMHGLLRKPEFLGIFRFVAERAYADGTGFRTWWQRRGQG